MKSTVFAAAIFASLLFTGRPASAGTFSYSTFTSDADSGISALLNYTAVADFNGTGLRSVNGVAFADFGANGTNSSYSLSGTGATFVNNGSNVTGDSNGLVSDFVYTGDTSGNASLVLNNLIIGQSYVTSWYNTAFGGAGGRKIDITPSDTGVAFNFDENYNGASNGLNNGNVLRYAFTATAPSITFGFDAVSNGDSFHHYAMTNSVANTAVLATPVVSATTGPGPFTPYTVRNDDLLQTHLSGVTAQGNFTRDGAGGVAALTDGIFLINGGNPANNSAFATGEDNASIVFDLDITTAALGYDISSIATYGGWNDSGRDRQLFKISISLVGSSDFTYLGALDFNPTAAGDPSAVSGIFDTTLTHVDAIRFDFFAGQENTYAGYGEFDVIGSATTIPEPGSAALLVAGAAGVLMRRRRNA
ncbi:MAG: motif protein [Chthoniobacteraceae bacterium]|nr:motif protein [Chthoniobacteraceae bacterium]